MLGLSGILWELAVVAQVGNCLICQNMALYCSMPDFLSQDYTKIFLYIKSLYVVILVFSVESNTAGSPGVSILVWGKGGIRGKMTLRA